MPFSLYFHIPFCTHRCAYCDFNTYAGQESRIPAYVQALCREIEIVGSQFPSPSRRGARGEVVHTVFFGGGTPSLLTVSQFEQIFSALRAHFDLLPEAEISLEANPGTVTLDSLRGLRSLGFNRISFGVQSFHPDELCQLERIHDPFDVFRAVEWARRAGFDNLNLDLIYGLPEQRLDRWSATVKQAVALHPEHLSLYALTLEHGTPFGRWAARGLLPVPDPDAAAEMYERAGEVLEAHGYVQYEISNWARDESPSSGILPPFFACRHNLTYWRCEPYLGFGAGAHGYFGDLRVANVLRINSYIEKVSTADLPPASGPQPSAIRHPLSVRRPPSALRLPYFPACVSRQRLTLRQQMQETMMLGLRLTREGVSAREFADRFQVQMTDAFGKEIDELLALGLLEWVEENSLPQVPILAGDSRLRLTPRARLLGNQVFMRFV